MSFEDGIFADIYSSKNREKIVPISFKSIQDDVPAPFNKLKGMQFRENPTNKEMDIFVSAMIRKHLLNKSRK